MAMGKGKQQIMPRLKSKYANRLALARNGRELKRQSRLPPAFLSGRDDVNINEIGTLSPKLPRTDQYEVRETEDISQSSSSEFGAMPQLSSIVPVSSASSSSVATKKEIEELNSTIQNIKIEKRKLEKKVERYKWLLSSFSRNQEVYREKVNLEKCNLRIQVKRLEGELHQMKSQKFEVKLNNPGDVAQIRPLGSSTRFKSYVHIPCSATASCPSRSSLQYRTIILRECTSLLSGHSIASQARQIVSFLHSDVNILARVKQELATSSPDCQFSLTPAETLHFMSTVNLSFFQMKMMKRFFVNKRGITLFCSDAKLREESDLQMPNCSFLLQKLSFREDQQEVVRPCIRVESLKEFFTESWQKTRRTQKLVDSPEFGKSIWLAFGGDKGGPSTKLVICFLNVENPHSIANLHLFACYLGSDSCINMNKAFGSYFQEFDEIKNMCLSFPTSNGEELRRLKIFLFGDSNFLSHFMGHQGSSSSKPCLFCHIGLQHLRNPTIEKIINQTTVNRTLPEIIFNAKSYCTTPITVKNAAQLYNNIIAQPLFPIEVRNIAIPIIHMQLGIAASLWSMMYDECLNHDLQQLGMIEKIKKKRAVKVLQEKVKECETEKKMLGKMERTLGIIKKALKIARKSTKIQIKESDDNEKKNVADFFVSAKNYRRILSCGFIVMIVGSGTTPPAYCYSLIKK